MTAHDLASIDTDRAERFICGSGWTPHCPQANGSQMTLNSHLGWHQQSVDDVLSALRSNSEYGLTTADAENRLRSHGRNELVERGQRSAAAILLEQFRGPMILMLVIAAVVWQATHGHPGVASPQPDDIPLPTIGH